MKEVLELARKKAKQSGCNCRISAIAFNKKGEVMATAINKHGSSEKIFRGKHAEMECLKKCKSTPKSMLICRVNPKGEFLPLDPCENCRKVLEKHNVKIMTINSNSTISKI